MNTVQTPVYPIIIIDDEPAALQSVEMNLRVAGYNNIVTCSNPHDALATLRIGECALILLDVAMPDANGFDVLKEIKVISPQTPVIMVTGNSDIDMVINCLKSGANDYLTKPLESERLITSVKNSLRMGELERDYTRLAQSMLSETLEHPEMFEHIHTQSENMLRLFKYVESVARTNHPVLITGETGVGKELFAQAIHKLSGSNNIRVTVNVAGLDDAMFSDTLFGHVKGAFTGADAARKGLIEKAAGGSIFLDEIGDLSIQSQVKLLRLVQEKEYFQLGSDVTRYSQARIITATCRTIEELSTSAAFRKDLFYRLRTHHLHIPALRERKKDVPYLIDHFIKKTAQELGKPDIHVPPELYTLLSTYQFPGNVRELESMVFDAMSSTHRGKLSLQIFYDRIGESGKRLAPQPEDKVTFHGQLPTLKEIEHLVIQEAFSRAQGNQTVAASLLGITRQTLSYRLKQVNRQR